MPSSCCQRLLQNLPLSNVSQTERRLLREREADFTQAERVHAALFSLQQYRDAQRIAVFLSMPSGEISTTKIVDDALGNGKKVFVPFIYKQVSEDGPSSVMDMLELRSRSDFASFQPDKWGIPTAPEESIDSRLNCFGSHGRTNGRDTSDALESRSTGLDLVVMPGMLFDDSFGRLGHGMGFYDRFLDRYGRHAAISEGMKMPYLVGLALQEQVLPAKETVPMDATDWRVDALISGSGNLRQRETA